MSRIFASASASASALTFVLSLLAPAAAADSPVWDPSEFAASRTIELRVVDDHGEEYWFPVWVVVLDDAVFVRLGHRAADRLKFNARFPDIGVRVGDKQFDRVHAEYSTGDVERVAAAMAEKYWSDIFIRWLSHPRTVRLVPVRGTPTAAATE